MTPEFTVFFALNLLDIPETGSTEEVFFAHGEASFSVTNKKKLSFHAVNGEDFTLETEQVEQGKFLLAAYRFEGSVLEISLNGADFEKFISSDEHLFDLDGSEAWLGGRGEVPFGGALGEAMFTMGKMEDAEVGLILNQLKTKYLDINEGLDLGIVKEVALLLEGEGGGKGDGEGEEDNGKPKTRVNRDSELTEIEKEQLKNFLEEKANVIKERAADEEKSNIDLLVEKHEAALKLAAEETEKEIEAILTEHEIKIGEEAKEEEEAEEKKYTIGGCKGKDAFAGVGVDGWEPPDDATAKDVSDWEEETRKFEKKIADIKVGGEALRDYIHKQVAALKLVRHALFCDKNK